MSFKSHINQNYWNDSRHLFFTPKLSLQGKNLFPQIADVNAIHSTKQTPFLNILKKPIMSLYDKVHVRNQKRPVCIVGLSKQVENRNAKTSQFKRNRKGQTSSTEENQSSNLIKQAIITYTPVLLKSEIIEHQKSLSKKSLSTEGLRFYLVGPGNNSKLIEQILSRREGWHPSSNSIFHFRWDQLRPKFQNISAPHRQVINHLPNHEAISDKNCLLDSLRGYCEKNNEMLFRIIPASFSLDFSNKETIQNEMKKFVQFMWECSNQQKNEELEDSFGGDLKKNSLRLKDGESQNDTLDSPKKLKKDLKQVNLKSMRGKGQTIFIDKKRQQIRSLYKTLVTTLKPLYNFQDMSNVRRDNPFLIPEVSEVYGDSSLWLFKPSDLNRGRGIKLFKNVEELGELLNQELIKNQKGSFILQKYLERPMLIQERKFDIRVWAMVSHLQQIYFFKEGYIRLSSQKFTLDSKSLFTHLTNNAVQKFSSTYGEFEEGNILPLSYLQEHGLISRNELYSQMKRLIYLSMKAAGNKLHVPGQRHKSISISSNPDKQKGNCNKTKYFEVFGYDFMIDCNKHTWLIEVNTNPCIQLSNSWLSTIIPRMLDDALKITLDRIFYKKSVLKETSPGLPVPNYSDSQNLWELLEGENPEEI